MTAPSPPSGSRTPNVTRKRVWLYVGLAVVSIVSTIGAVLYIVDQNRYVYTDKAEVSAPLIKLTAGQSGILKRVMVTDGEWLYANESVARIGDQIVQTQVPGIAVQVKQDIGANYGPGDAVVTEVEPKELRVVARIEEDKGLKDIYIGQTAFFTVDAFGSKRYEGTVESISDTNRQGDVVFNISDKRETKEFDVKIAYNYSLHPELQNGMSARVWIIK